MTSTELFNTVFPYYLSIGCSYEEFWNGSPWLATAYKEAEIYRMERRNYDAWLQGLYFSRAVSSSLAMAFWNRKGQRPDGYFENPIPITEREKQEEQKRQIEKTKEFFRNGQKK